MNKNVKMMMARKRRKDGTFMEYMGMNPYDLYGNEYGQPWTPKMERSGSFSVGRDGTRTPVYPMSKEMPWSIEVPYIGTMSQRIGLGHIILPMYPLFILAVQRCTIKLK